MGKEDAKGATDIDRKEKNKLRKEGGKRTSKSA